MNHRAEYLGQITVVLHATRTVVGQRSTVESPGGCGCSAEFPGPRRRVVEGFRIHASRLVSFGALLKPAWRDRMNRADDRVSVRCTGRGYVQRRAGNGEGTR